MARKSKSTSLTTNQMATEALMMRNRLAAFMGYSHAGQRDLYEVFGWDRQPDVQALFAMYLRNPVANRIIRAFPQATWNACPMFNDENGNGATEGSEEYSPFAESVEDFFEANRIYRFIERADRVASIGRFGILLMGFADGKPLSQALTSRKAKLLYLSPYGETSCRVDRYDEDSKSPRFGMPLTYRLNPGNDFVVPGSSGAMPRKGSVIVHHSRVIHIAEYLEEDEVYGVPRLLPLMNHLRDLEKMVGGNAEVFWLNANRGTLFNVDPLVTLDAEGVQNIKDQADEFQHQLRRYLVGQGVKAEVLGSDPTENDRSVGVLMDLIAGGAGMPKRILTGSEAGELASSQDESNWSSRISERRMSFATPQILRPLVQKLIDTGNIIAPTGEWWPEWPKHELGEQAAVDIAVKKTDCLVRYVMSPGADLLVPPPIFMRDFLGMQPHEDLEDDALEAKREEDAQNADVPEKDDEKPNTNARVRTAYVSRKVMNAKDIVKWAKAQGFKQINDDLHVTVAYVQMPFDWMKAGQSFDEEMTFAAGGPRSVELFGEGVAVIEFSSGSLTWRNQDIYGVSGQSWEQRPDYKPHITFSNDFDIETFRNAKPYNGRIVLGPEIWEEIQ